METTPYADDFVSIADALRNEGILILLGMQQGVEKGMQQGIEQGIKQGIQQVMQQVAMSMLEEGMSDSMILKITNINKEQLNKLKANN